MVLYKVVSSYRNRFEILKSLTNHGFTPLKNLEGKDSKFLNYCITTGGYISGLFCTAYYNNFDDNLAYLLAENGFYGTYSNIRTSDFSDHSIRVENLIAKNQDLDMVRFLFSLSLDKKSLMKEIYGDIAYYYDRIRRI